MNSVALCSSGSNNSGGNSSKVVTVVLVLVLVLVLAIAASQKVLLLRALQVCRKRVSERRQKEIETHTERERGRPSNHALKFFAPSDKGVCLAIPVRNGGYL